MLKTVLEEEEYEHLRDNILREIGKSGFPFILECTKPKEVTLEEVRETVVRLNMDTGLDVSFNVGLNGDRGMVHCVMVVDEIPEAENGKPLLQ